MSNTKNLFKNCATCLTQKTYLKIVQHVSHKKLIQKLCNLSHTNNSSKNCATCLRQKTQLKIVQHVSHKKLN